MRASTLLGLALALFVGLIVVAGIRYSGIFSPKATVTETKKAESPVMVLAATRNLFEGTSPTSQDVGLRRATDAEIKLINEGVLLPAHPEAAQLLVLKRNVAANDALKKDYFEEMSLPEGVGKRIGPGMRAVDVELPKDRAAAGLLRRGEHVDVYLTSKVCTDEAGSNPRTAIAPIAKNLKIVVKRDVLYTLMIPVPEDKPVSYILEANPYRAALIEFSKSKGNITLVATSSQGKMADIGTEREEELVNRFIKGEASVSERDLEKIFRLDPLPATPQPLRVEMFEAGKLTSVTLVQAPVPTTYERFEGGYRFFMPADAAKLTVKLDPAKKDNAANPIGVKSLPMGGKK
jgi:Flp pilus assembly protein CpaB